MATLFSGQSLYPGQSLQSNNKLHTLVMQSDGNVVFYNQRSQAIWATNTGGLITPGNFIMQTDGNLVLYDSNGRPRWASNTWNHPEAFLDVQDDGNLVVYRAGSQTETADNALWASGSNDIPGPDTLPLNLNNIPTEWKQAATPYVPMVPQGFASQGINNRNVFAYACATISHESSWNPNAVNTTDVAANTGYPGAGLAQITWEANYKAVGDATGIDFADHPEYMFDPYKSICAQAAFFKLNGMIPYIESGDYESAAGKYNTGDFSGRNEYTREVANDTSLWLPVFS
jgi:hypothetical protein